MGVSVYRHTGADHFTSRRMLEAEQRIVDAAGRASATAPDSIDVELAVMATALDGPTLNDGQRVLVRSMVADPRQVALALAPAGAGKTTAMSVLATVCRDLGYDVVGLAPSAAAAAVLGEATGMPTETLAMLDHALAGGTVPDLGPRTVVVIDEAGMADTPTLDRVIAACTVLGTHVRLIGDDQQLAAVGAGGVLRDIGHHPWRRTCRRGRPLRRPDRGDRFAGAPGGRPVGARVLPRPRPSSRRRERRLPGRGPRRLAERADGRPRMPHARPDPRPGRAAQPRRPPHPARGASPIDEVELADGNHASAGETILTRHNDRRLGVSSTDWVKNGDRWTITALDPSGALHVRHLRSGVQVTLPAAYVAEHVELGYATTVHAAQGSTADIMHGILTGTEDRQLLYTMLTRGRCENHLHLIAEATPPETDEQFLPGITEHLTAVETLDRIISRDGAAVAATTERGRATSPATLLHEAAIRYAGAVTTAARRLLGSEGRGRA